MRRFSTLDIVHQKSKMRDAMDKLLAKLLRDLNHDLDEFPVSRVGKEAVPNHYFM